jgi:hypothetical protein
MIWFVLGVLFLFYTIDWTKFILDLTEESELASQTYRGRNYEVWSNWGNDANTWQIMPTLQKRQDKVNWRQEGF